MSLLRGKTAVITGANRGVGKALVRVFASSGAHVFACARKPSDELESRLRGLANETQTRITPVYFDLSSADQVKEAAKSIVSAEGSLDVLVNNAGMISTSLFQMTPIDKMRELFEVNFFGPLLFTQYLAKKMTRQKSGSIIHISSSAAIEGNEGRCGYASSKAALLTSTKVMAKELAAFNIRVNAVAPGLTDTDMMRESTNENALQETLNRICMKRLGQPEEIANAVMFLASDLSSYMTGQVLRVDGGM